MCYRFFVDGQEITAEEAAEIEWSKRYGWNENLFVERISTEYSLQKANIVDGEFIDDDVYSLNVYPFYDDYADSRLSLEVVYNKSADTYIFSVLYDDESPVGGIVMEYQEYELPNNFFNSDFVRDAKEEIQKRLNR